MCHVSLNPRRLNSFIFTDKFAFIFIESKQEINLKMLSYFACRFREIYKIEMGGTAREKNNFYHYFKNSNSPGNFYICPTGSFKN